MSQPDRPDPSQLRVSDADRHSVAEILRTAAGEGRLDLDELDQRLEAAYTAKTYADLVPITADLPAVTGSASLAVPSPGTPAVPASSHQTSVAIMSGTSRRGIWQVPPRHTAFALMGGVDIDLREAQFTAAETVVVANAIWGGIDIVVNADTQVVVDGVGVMGTFEQARDKVPAETTAASPVVRVTGFALMGAVTVVRKPMPGTPKKYFGRY